MTKLICHPNIYLVSPQDMTPFYTWYQGVQFSVDIISEKLLLMDLSGASQNELMAALCAIFQFDVPTSCLRRRFTWHYLRASRYA